MNYKGELIRRYFSTHYQHYIPKTVELWNWVIDRIELNFGDIFSSIPRHSLILDVACGVGYLECYLLRKGFTNIHAIDLSGEQIKIAKEKLTEHGLDYNGQVEFEVVDAFEKLRKSRNYNVLVMVDFIEHFSKNEILELLHLSYDALHDGGLFILRMPNAENLMFGSFYHDFTHETPFTIRSIRQCLTMSGFQVIRINYEKMPEIKGKIWSVRRFKQFIRFLGLALLGKLLGISPAAAFSGDLVAIAKK